MTIQQLRYCLTIAHLGSITQAAKDLYISQSTLSFTIQQLEKELGFAIFIRRHKGIDVTQEGQEFLAYAQKAMAPWLTLEQRYFTNENKRIRFAISAQHFTFCENAFVHLVKQYQKEDYDFYYNATSTNAIMDDVKYGISELGILRVDKDSKKVFDKEQLSYTPLFTCHPHVFLARNHPLAQKKSITLEELYDYPRLSFVQGRFTSKAYQEEMFSDLVVPRTIQVNDRGAIVNFMLGLQGYTISSGIFPKYLHGDAIVSIPLVTDETMEIGYITLLGHTLSELAQQYITAIQAYDPSLSSME